MCVCSGIEWKPSKPVESGLEGFPCRQKFTNVRGKYDPYAWLVFIQRFS